jgi:hypothetical protein
MERIGVKDEPEKQRRGFDRKYMVERSPLTVCVVQAYFEDAVRLSFPAQEPGEYLSERVVKDQVDRDRGIDALNHMSEPETKPNIFSVRGEGMYVNCEGDYQSRSI